MILQILDTMIYYKFRFLNSLFTFFGMRMPFLQSNGKPCNINIIHKLWSLILIGLLGIGYFIMINITMDFDMKKNLDKISDTNENMVNFFLLLTNLFGDKDVCIKLYRTMIEIIEDLKIGCATISGFLNYSYFWFTVYFVMFVTFLILEIIYDEPPHNLVLRIPIFFTFCHLLFHLQLVLIFVKSINYHLDKKVLNLNIENEPLKNKKGIGNVISSIFHFDEVLRKDQSTKYFELRALCKTFEKISNSIQFLENQHGKQMLLIIWSMFSNAVVGVTLVTRKQVTNPWILFINSSLTLFWYFVACYVDEKIRKEIEKMQILIMKHLIEVRTDQIRKNILHTFKQMLRTHHVHFTASSLFTLSYAMILATIINVITYSIILIQLFLSNN